MLTLDAGCGSHFTHIPTLLHVNADVKADIEKTTENQPFIDVVCDVQCLPFRSNTFDVVFCSHTIEHADNPTKAIKELLRVTKPLGIVEINTPYRFGSEAKSPQHKHYFNKKWFQQTLKNFPNRINYRLRPNTALTISLPPVSLEINVIIKKSQIKD